MFKNFVALFLAFLVLCISGLQVQARGHGCGRPGPAPHHGYRPAPPPPPRYYGYHHHYYDGPSRGWYNGALVTSAILGAAAIAVEASKPAPVIVQPTTTVVQPVPVVQPAPVYVQPTPVYVPPATVLPPSNVYYTPQTIRY